MKTHQLHIIVGCADARDLSQLQLDVVNEKSREFQSKGITIEMHVLRAAGSFITQDIFQDIQLIILQSQKTNYVNYNRHEYFVHIQTHGDLTETSNREYLSHIYEMNIVEGSPLNCGMLGATGVGVELEQLIVKSQLEYICTEGKLKVVHDEDIRTLLRNVYAHDGYLAGDWIKSIDYLRTHPRSQKAKLEKLINNDPDLKRLDIKITAGILDYSIHALIRLDDGIPEVPWWDEVQIEIRKRNTKEKESVLKQAEQQQPLAGLLCTSDPRSTSRSLAANYYLDKKGIAHGGKYIPNTIFNITGNSFDIPYTPFGPYVIAGFFYAVKSLELTDQMVLGNSPEQTQRMLIKLQNDPIMNLIIETFKVNIIPLNQQELAKK